MIFPLRASETEGGLSFLNIPATAKSSLLGNTLTSGLYSPGSLFQNPANIWNSAPYRMTYTIRRKNLIDSGYQSFFATLWPRKLGNIVFGVGYVDYSVDKIEEYDINNIFIDYFDWHDRCVGIGLSARSMGILWGVGGNYIFRSTSYDASFSETYSNIDLGLTIENIKIKNVNLSISYVLKNTIGKNDDISTTSLPKFIIGTQISTTLFKLSEDRIGPSEISIKFHSDLYRANEPILFFRSGLEFLKPILQYGNIIFGFGYRKFPLLLDKDYAVDIKSLRKYNKKYSYGIVFDLKLNKILNNNMSPFSSAIFGYTNETNYGMDMLDLHHITIELVSYNK